MKEPFIRFLWFLGLVLQVVLYVVSFSRVSAIAMRHQVEGGAALNTVLVDVLGFWFWCGALVCFEQRSWPVWLRCLLVVLCLVVALAVVRLDVLACIGA